MRHHELKNYLKFTMNKKPDKMKKYKRFCTRTDRNFFQKMFIIKEGCQIGSQWQNANKFYMYENFSWRHYCRRLSQNDLNFFKDYFILNCKLWDKFLISILNIGFTYNPFNTHFASKALHKHKIFFLWYLFFKLSSIF